MSLSRNPKLIAVSKQVCRELRKKSTEAEKAFWEKVRNRNFIDNIRCFLICTARKHFTLPISIAMKKN